MAVSRKFVRKAPPADFAGNIRGRKVRLPRQRGGPAKGIHLVPTEEQDEFIALTLPEIRRMLRKRRRGLLETGNKVDLWLRLHEDIRLEKYESRPHRGVAAAAAASAEGMRMEVGGLQDHVADQETSIGIHVEDVDVEDVAQRASNHVTPRQTRFPFPVTPVSAHKLQGMQCDFDNQKTSNGDRVEGVEHTVSNKVARPENRRPVSPLSNPSYPTPPRAPGSGVFSGPKEHRGNIPVIPARVDRKKNLAAPLDQPVFADGTYGFKKLWQA